MVEGKSTIPVTDLFRVPPIGNTAISIFLNDEPGPVFYISVDQDELVSPPLGEVRGVLALKLLDDEVSAYGRTSRHHGEDGPDHFLGLFGVESVPSPQKLQMGMGVVGFFKVVHWTFCGGGGG